MAKITVVVTGIREIDLKLRTLDLRVQKKVTRQAMRNGLKLMKAEVQAQAPVRTGLTKASVIVRAVPQRKRGRIELETRISGKVPGLTVKPHTGKSAFYPAIVEYGRKDMPPNPFMRRAYDTKGRAARDVTIHDLKVGIEVEASK